MKFSEKTLIIFENRRKTVKMTRKKAQIRLYMKRFKVHLKIFQFLKMEI